MSTEKNNNSPRPVEAIIYDETQPLMSHIPPSPNAPKETSTNTKEIYRIIVSTNKENKNKLKRLPPPNAETSSYTVVFELDPEEVEDYQIREITFNTNYPINKEGEDFDRLKFSEHKINTNSTKTLCEISVTKSGIYEYYLEDNKESKNYFLVDPLLLKTNNKEENIKIEELNIVTVIPTLIENSDEDFKEGWNKFINKTKDNGYNMIHFVPIQQMGSSNSPYSIKDQLKIENRITKNNQSNEDTFKQILKSKETGMLKICDLVLNHTSNNSEWLKEHPESAYNLKNSNHLKSAYLVDKALKDISLELIQNNISQYEINSEQKLNELFELVREKIENIKLYKYITIDIELSLAGMKEHLTTVQDNFQFDNLDSVNVENCISEINSNKSKYFSVYNQSQKAVNYAAFLELICPKASTSDKNNNDTQKFMAKFKSVLETLNVDLYKEYNYVLESIMTNSRNYVKYQRLEDNGPRVKALNKKCLIFPRYFTNILEDDTTETETKLNSDTEQYIVANNGWIWDNSDPTKDFADSNSSVYLKREVVVWEDCVKLNYNTNNKESYLYEHMKNYTKEVASLFDGIRIDNCHSTPLPLATYLIDYARTINNNLLVVAELFTGSTEMDARFVNQLGINLLIREAMQSNSSFELSRLSYMYGGAVSNPAGSLVYDQAIIRDSYPPALFMDCTHDNQTPYQKRTVIDSLSNSAIVYFCDCAVGSVKGYDELYPHHIEFGTEGLSRKYFNNTTQDGIIEAKSELSHIHFKMHNEGYTECHVHHENEVIIIHRQHPTNHDGYLLISSTAFYEGKRKQINPIRMENTKAHVEFGYSIGYKDWNKDSVDSIIKDKDYYKGLNSLVYIKNHSGENNLGFITEEKNTTIVDINKIEWFEQGSVLIIKTELNQDVKFMKEINSYLENCKKEITTEFDLEYLNVMLYRTDQEERDFIGNGNGQYVITNYNNYKTVYCGLQGFKSILDNVVRKNDLGHPICEHLRQGLWMFDYIISRIKLYSKEYFVKFQTIVPYLEGIGEILRLLPTHLRPKYFIHIVFELYQYCLERALGLMGTLLEKDVFNRRFISDLALCSVQLNGVVKSSGLSPNKSELTSSLAAGLPHFATDYMRLWGRDVCISITGLFIVTGQTENAKKHILQFASTVNNGLVPNLLDSLRNPRYNSRDSVWWFLQAVQNYVKTTNDKSILTEKVKRRHPQKIDRVVEYDDELAFSETNTLAEIIHEIMNKHANGIKFREHNAGIALDSHMLDQGFNIEINFDSKTGFLFGGNPYNCGTWMDKMGEYRDKKGIPSTPRDGAAIEIIGLLKSTLRWLTEISNTSEFQYEKVFIQDTNKELTYAEWNHLVQENFEKCFYVPKVEQVGSVEHYDIDEKVVNKRQIYKDTYKSSKGYSDYQLRPNFLVAMAVADELFDKEHAANAVDIASSSLIGPLGMKTLDKDDWEYRPVYDNSNYGDDLSIAKGYNYHQGPEWGWPIGYFLMAYYKFNKESSKQEILGEQELFEDAVKKVIKTVSFDINSKVQLFECNIRILGALLSAHLLAKDERFKYRLSWYRDELLEKALDLGYRLLGAYNRSKTDIPYARVNLKYGTAEHETSETCLAGAGTLLLEFGVLSRLTGNQIFENYAKKTIKKLWDMRFDGYAFGNTIDCRTATWKEKMTGVGAGTDSFYEYLFKSAVLFNDKEMLKMFKKTYLSIMKYNRDISGSYFLNIHSESKNIHNTWIDSLSAFFPGLQTLSGDLLSSIKPYLVFYNIWKRFSGLPERYDISTNTATYKFYPLRPEFVESTYYLYMATKDPFYLKVGERILKDLNKTRTNCGFATYNDIVNKKFEDRMESFFLSETLKYLYLLFDVNNPINKIDTNMVFSTEGHVLYLPYDLVRNQNNDFVALTNNDQCLNVNNKRIIYQQYFHDCLDHTTSMLNPNQ